MTTMESKKRQRELGDANDRATIIFVVAAAVAITFAWVVFLGWWLI